MRETWTDERLDDLKDQVGELTRRVDQGFAEIRTEMSSRFDSIDARFDAMHQTMLQMQRTIIHFAAVMIAALIGLIASQAALAIGLA